jgi:hypothetical protein
MIFLSLTSIARRYGIRAIRLSRNCGSGIGLLKRTYKWVFNTRLRIYGLAETKYFGGADDARTIINNRKGDIEVMVHTRRGPNGLMVELDGVDLQQRIEALRVGDQSMGWHHASGVYSRSRGVCQR